MWTLQQSIYETTKGDEKRILLGSIPSHYVRYDKEIRAHPAAHCALNVVDSVRDVKAKIMRMN